MTQYYTNNVDFFSLFEADTFDVEVQEGNTFMGYIFDDAGNKLLAATFDYDNANDCECGGTGWWDSELI